MNFSVDSAIFVAFLAVNLLVGLKYGKGVKTVEDYALGGRNFSTGVLSSTIVATWIGGGFFSFLISKTYSDGVYYIIPILMDYVVTFFIIGYFLSARMGKFLGKISVAEAMGDLYGKNVRIITAISGFLAISGLVGIQFKVAAQLYSYFFNISGIYAMLGTSIIVTIYSAFGGIRSVTFTDVMQFFTFGTLIPIIFFLIWEDTASIDSVFTTIKTNPNFNLSDFSLSDSKFINAVHLSLIFIIPALHPSIFQRISMAQNVSQMRKSFLLSSFFSILIVAVTCWIGVLMLSVNPNLQPDKVWLYIIDNYSAGIGMKGLIVIGITAMMMSTADSYINSASILASHDIYGVLGRTTKEKELFISKILSFSIGVISIVLALFTTDILSLMLLANNFYIPVVTVPLLAAIFGFRTTSRSVLVGMVAGVAAVIYWRLYFMELTQVDSIIPGAVVNLLFMIGSHYLLKQPGEWAETSKSKFLEPTPVNTKSPIYSYILSIKNFNFLMFCRNNTPKEGHVFVFFGLFCIFSIFFTILTFPKGIQNTLLLKFTYYTVLFFSTLILSYPILPSFLKRESAVSVFWVVAVPYILVFAPTTLVMISNFGQFQLMIFLLNMVILSLLVRWKAALFMICFAVILSMSFYRWYIGVEGLGAAINIGTQFKIIYALLLVSSILIGFLKPKQEYQELTEERNNHLALMIKDREEELGKAQELKHEFLRNLEHEVNTPLVGLTSLAPMVLEDFDRLTPKQMKKYVKSIVDSHERYKTLSDNLLDLSKLDSMKYKLSKVKLNLSDLIKGRLAYCRRLYLNNKELEFAMDIDPDVVIESDEHYITSLIDNLIINAIKYSKEGTITLRLHRKEAAKVEFQIIDEGIGIPKAELHDIFGAFVVSSKTRTPSGGRGIGLALCKKIAEVHGGSIRADSDGEKGAAFIVELPMLGASPF